MSSAATIPQDQLDIVQHPYLGPLKFPKEMPYDQRNQIIGNLEVSPEGMQEKSRQQASADVRKPLEMATAPGERGPGEAPTAVSRFAEATTGSPHPLDAFVHGDVPAFVGSPGEYTKNLIGAEAKLPARAAYSAVMHPLDTAEQIMPVNRAIGDVRAGRIGAAAGDMAGGLVNTLGLEKGAAALPETADTAAAGMNRIGAPAPDPMSTLNEALEPSRIGKGQTGLRTALNTQPGRGGAQAAAMDGNIGTATNDLAKINRDTPLTTKGANRFGELAENIADYKQNLWEQGHSAPVGRHAQMPFDKDAVLQKTLAEIRPEDDTAQARLATQWAQREIPKLDNLQNADTKVRLLNKEIKALPERYGPVGVRVRQAAVQALRDQIDSQLTDAGESGVRDVNRRWGALASIENRLRERAPAEWQRESRTSPVPDWMHAYVFAHPTGASLGLGIRLAKMLGAPDDATVLGRAAKALGRTSLSPPGLSEPDYVGKEPIGLLPPAPIRIGSVPDKSGPIRLGEPRIEPSTRAQRLGLLLPEESQAARPVITPAAPAASETRALPQYHDMPPISPGRRLPRIGETSDLSPRRTIIPGERHLIGSGNPIDLIPPSTPPSGIRTIGGVITSPEGEGMEYTAGNRESTIAPPRAPEPKRAPGTAYASLSQEEKDWVNEYYQQLQHMPQALREPEERDLQKYGGATKGWNVRELLARRYIDARKNRDVNWDLPSERQGGNQGREPGEE